jgi:hypothetical protein
VTDSTSGLVVDQVVGLKNCKIENYVQIGKINLKNMARKLQPIFTMNIHLRKSE